MTLWPAVALIRSKPFLGPNMLFLGIFPIKMSPSWWGTKKWLLDWLKIIKLGPQTAVRHHTVESSWRSEALQDSSKNYLKTKLGTGPSINHISHCTPFWRVYWFVTLRSADCWPPGATWILNWSFFWSPGSLSELRCPLKVVGDSGLVWYWEVLTTRQYLAAGATRVLTLFLRRHPFQLPDPVVPLFFSFSFSSAN